MQQGSLGHGGGRVFSYSDIAQGRPTERAGSDRHSGCATVEEESWGQTKYSEVMEMGLDKWVTEWEPNLTAVDISSGSEQEGESKEKKQTEEKIAKEIVTVKEEDKKNPGTAAAATQEEKEEKQRRRKTKAEWKERHWIARPAAQAYQQESSRLWRHKERKPVPKKLSTASKSDTEKEDRDPPQNNTYIYIYMAGRRRPRILGNKMPRKTWLAQFYSKNARNFWANLHQIFGALFVG